MPILVVSPRFSATPIQRTIARLGRNFPGYLALAATTSMGCGAATEPAWEDSGRRILPRDPSAATIRPNSGSDTDDAATDENGKTQGGKGPKNGDQDKPGAQDRPGSSGGANAESPIAGGDGDIAVPPSSEADGTRPVPPVGDVPLEPSDPPAEDIQAVCATTPLWVNGELTTEGDVTTATSWLVPARDSSAIGWSLMTRPALVQRFVLGTGALTETPDEMPGVECENFSPAWSQLLGTHAVSAEFFARTLPCPKETVSPAGVLDGGALALTPDASRLVKVRCAADHTELDVFTLDGDGAATTFALSGEACPTRMLVTQSYALVADNSPALRYIDLDDGAELFSYPLPGPAGQLDTTEDASRVLLSTLRLNLIDLKPGVFDADALVLSVPVSALHETPKPTDVTARLSFVNSGSLVSDAEFAPGYIQLPAALHPRGTLTATFGTDEKLIALDTVSNDAVVLEPDAVPSELLAQEPRSTGLPTAVEFSSDGRFLARVRGGQLAVFACSERSRP